jgi:hypothetical protein
VSVVTYVVVTYLVVDIPLSPIMVVRRVEVTVDTCPEVTVDNEYDAGTVDTFWPPPFVIIVV